MSTVAPSKTSFRFQFSIASKNFHLAMICYYKAYRFDSEGADGSARTTSYYRTGAKAAITGNSETPLARVMKLFERTPQAPCAVADPHGASKPVDCYRKVPRRFRELREPALPEAR